MGLKGAQGRGIVVFVLIGLSILDIAKMAMEY